MNTLDIYYVCIAIVWTVFAAVKLTLFVRRCVYENRKKRELLRRLHENPASAEHWAIRAKLAGLGVSTKNYDKP